MTKKLYIKTWGCQMNVYDSQKMADVLAPLGFSPTQDASEADMVILNTCHIREKATDKVFSELGRLKKHKRAKEGDGKQMIMAVAGCVAQAEGDFIASRAPYVDMVFGPQSYHLLPEMVARASAEYGHKRVINTDFAPEAKFDMLEASHSEDAVTAFLSIQEGCDKFCTFCVVPYTRGAEYSRNLESIVAEAKRLVAKGAKEITLLGQNVNAWHGETGENFGDLLYALADIKGLERLRYMTSHPRDMHDRLYDAHRDLDILMPYLHLPVQAGSDAVLKMMNRKHTGDDYRRIIDRLRENRPDIQFSSDFIVGFPGEKDADFEDTLRLVRDVRFIMAYSFKYSARPGTPAAKMGGLVREEVKSDRLAALQQLLAEQGEAINTTATGRTMPVLVDRKGTRDGWLQGKTPYYQLVHFKGNKRLIGQVVPVEIATSSRNSLTGQLVTQEKLLETA